MYDLLVNMKSMKLTYIPSKELQLRKMREENELKDLRRFVKNQFSNLSRKNLSIPIRLYNL